MALLRIVQDDAEHVPPTSPQAAHAMPMLDPICAAKSSHRAIANGKNHELSLIQRRNFDARLLARPLLSEDEFTAFEIAVRLGKQDGGLEWKDVFPVKILVKTIEIAG